MFGATPITNIRATWIGVETRRSFRKATLGRVAMPLATWTDVLSAATSCGRARLLGSRVDEFRVATYREALNVAVLEYVCFHCFERTSEAIPRSTKMLLLRCGFS
jgi:hypothetical protein